MDETSINIGRKAHWLHVARTDTLTAYFRHESRGRKAVAEFGVMPAFTGTAVHDALAGVDPRHPARHALCGARILRELTAAAEAHPDQHWAAQARSALAELARLAAQARADGLTAIPPELAAEPLTLYRHGVLAGLAEPPRSEGRKQSKTRNLLERLRDREAEVLRFTDDLAVPFTNNGSGATSARPRPSS